MTLDLRRSMALVAAGALGLFGGRASAGATSKLVVEVAGLRSDKGKVGCELFASAEGYPTDATKAVRKMFVEIHGGQAACEFEDLPDGDYAIAVFHDENGNGKLDLGFLGIPKEGTGASRDAKGSFGPPHFADAHFAVSGNTTQVVHIAY